MSAKRCQVGYEVSLTIPGLKTTRSVVFVGRAAAQAFKRKQREGTKLQAVELCDGKIVRRGKRAF